MARKCWRALPVCLALAGILGAACCAMGRETEEQLLQQIQTEHDPVKKAKDEIRLANLKLTQVQQTYAQGHMEEGVKSLGAMTDALKAAWKTLQDSGRIASKQPQGFRELEIALREDVRVLQDLAHTVSYLDRAPLEKAAQDLDQMRSEVLHAQFPGRPPRTLKSSPPPPPAPSAESPPEAR